MFSVIEESGNRKALVFKFETSVNISDFTLVANVTFNEEDETFKDDIFNNDLDVFSKQMEGNFSLSLRNAKPNALQSKKGKNIYRINYLNIKNFSH